MYHIEFWSVYFLGHQLPAIMKYWSKLKLKKFYKNVIKSVKISHKLTLTSCSCIKSSQIQRLCNCTSSRYFSFQYSIIMCLSLGVTKEYVTLLFSKTTVLNTHKMWTVKWNRKKVSFKAKSRSLTWLYTSKFIKSELNKQTNSRGTLTPSLPPPLTRMSCIIWMDP